MKKNPLWSNLFKKQEDWVRLASDSCASNPLFQGLSSSVIRWIVSNTSHRQFSQNENIFCMGDEGAGALLILKGTVSIQVAGKELTQLTTGDLFGEVALLPNQFRTADAVAIEECDIVFFLRSDLQEWKESRPKQAYQLLENLGMMLSKRLLETNIVHGDDTPNENTQY